MKIFEIFETLKNTGHTIDLLLDNTELAREIRQTYNKVRKVSNIDPLKKKTTRQWAEVIRTWEKVKMNEELIDMLDYIIDKCK